jgi:site-specific DNA-methyltransferase (adenine-specific)
MKSGMGTNVFAGEIPNPDEWISQCYRVLKEGTHFYTFCNTNDLPNFLNSAKGVGFKFHNLITVIKDTKMPNRWYLKYCELILFFRKGDAKPINDMTSRDYMEVCMPKKSSGKLHITQKPLPLISKLVSNSSDKGATVLDPFMGSGTTGVACQNLNRDFIGIELDKEYFSIAKERIEKAQMELICTI